MAQRDFSGRKLAITVDTEARTSRAENDHVNRLIWCKVDGQEYGLRRMMDIADAHGAILTSFLDVPEFTCYGEDLLDAGREVIARGHDAQLHVHPEMFSPEFRKNHNIRVNDVIIQPLTPGAIVQDFIRQGKVDWQPDFCTKDDIKAYLDASLEIYHRFATDRPAAIRMTSYKMPPVVVAAMEETGIPISCNYNPSFPDRALFLQGIKEPFYWPKGMLELPVSCVVRPRGKRIEQYNFNTRWLLEADTETCVERHLQFLQWFYDASPKHRVAVLVLHSWSFLKMDEKGYFSIPNEHAMEVFDKVLERLSSLVDFVSLKEVAARKDTYFPEAVMDSEALEALEDPDRCIKQERDFYRIIPVN